MLSTQTQKIPKDNAPQNMDSKSKIHNYSSCHEWEPAETTASRIRALGIIKYVIQNIVKCLNSFKLNKNINKKK